MGDWKGSELESVKMGEWKGSQLESVIMGSVIISRFT